MSTEHTVISISQIPQSMQMIQNNKRNKCAISCNKCCAWFSNLPLVIKIIIISLVILLISLITFILYFGIELAKIFS
jgi:hypothetical protein